MICILLAMFPHLQWKHIPRKIFRKTLKTKSMVKVTKTFDRGKPEWDLNYPPSRKKWVISIAFANSMTRKLVTVNDFTNFINEKWSQPRGQKPTTLLCILVASQNFVSKNVFLKFHSHQAGSRFWWWISDIARTR